MVVVLAMSISGSPHATEAGKRKKPKVEAFELAVGGSHETRGGVTVWLDADWILRVGDDLARASNDEPWVELVADGKLYRGVPSGSGLRVTVLAAPDAPIDDATLVAAVEAEAAKRRVVYQNVGHSEQGGVRKVFLDRVVVGRIGTWSGKLLSFEVDPYATITPALPAGAKSGRLVAGDEVTVGGVTASLVMTNHEVGSNAAVADYRLTLRKGKKQKVVDAGWVEEPMFEVVALGKLVWVRGDEVIVAPAKKLAKKRISQAKAIAIAQAEADRRGIPHDGAGATGSNGVEYVTLAQGGTDVVQAVIGTRSKRFLRFDVSATGVTDAPPPKSTPDPVTTGDNAILDEHNRYRAAHCAPALTWSDELAQVAQAWAEHLRDDACGFYHSGSKHGENLAGGTTGSLTPEEVVGMWYREVDLYDFGNGGFGMDTDHFTQVVWKKTKRVGCGMVSDCAGMDLWVCNYDPPGNYDDQFATNVLPTSCR